jgi:tetratricopeptide (TPR) repeat protein
MAMSQTDVYDRIFEYPPTDVAELLLTEPDQITKRRKSKEVAAWELLLGAMQLRRAGERSPANDWLNHASRLSIDNDVFRAELLGEAGQGLYESDRLQDAFTTLNSAEAVWRDVCEQAEDACSRSKTEAAVEIALHLLPLFAAAHAKAPASVATVRSGSNAIPIVREWLAERAVVGRAQTASRFVRLLTKARQFDDARTILDEEMDWIAVTFTAPAKPASAYPLEQREMSRKARRGLYLLLLADGELALAADEFQRSADRFASAAALYQNQVEDYSDISRLLQAKCNQANSLLRLGRIQEALDIYELCEHGFNSIGQTSAAQRVAHAKLFAHTLADGDDES